MKSTIAILFLAVLGLAQTSAKPKPSKPAPRLAFVQTKDAPALVDTDLYDEQQYVEQTGSDSASIKAKRAEHETTLMREFLGGFNQAKECDGIVMPGGGDQKPDFGLNIMVDSHDLQGHKPVWVWILRENRDDMILPTGNDDSGREAATSICRAVWNIVDPDHLKKP